MSTLANSVEIVVTDPMESPGQEGADVAPLRSCWSDPLNLLSVCAKQEGALICFTLLQRGDQLC